MWLHFLLITSVLQDISYFTKTVAAWNELTVLCCRTLIPRMRRHQRDNVRKLTCFWGIISWRRLPFLQVTDSTMLTLTQRHSTHSRGNEIKHRLWEKLCFFLPVMNFSPWGILSASRRWGFSVRHLKWMMADLFLLRCYTRQQQKE